MCMQHCLQGHYVQLSSVSASSVGETFLNFNPAGMKHQHKTIKLFIRLEIIFKKKKKTVIMKNFYKVFY